MKQELLKGAGPLEKKILPTATGIQKENRMFWYSKASIWKKKKKAALLVNYLWKMRGYLQFSFFFDLLFPRCHRKKYLCIRRHHPLVSPCCFAMTAKMREWKIFNLFMWTFKRRNVSFVPTFKILGRLTLKVEWITTSQVDPQNHVTADYSRAHERSLCQNYNLTNKPFTEV